jgi:lysophospholipase L1-like esterase
MRFAARFGETYGTDGGGNVTLVNSGVGGTPSPFGYMRYGRDILARVPESDPDGYPDLVVIEYAVNDWAEPTGCRCYESMVREILSQPNRPAVILLFSARNDGWNVQNELQKIGERYDLLMVSVRDGLYKHLDRDFPKKNFYRDEYHPNSTGHAMMADAMMAAVADALAAETAETDIDLAAEPVYGTDFMGLKTIYGDSVPDGITVERGSFDKVDKTTYSNKPVGQVCGKNFCHGISSGSEPMRITGIFRKCLIAWKAAAEGTYGSAEILVDGKVKATLKGGSGKWGQSEVVLILDGKEAAEHTVEIRVAEEGKRFTITAVSVQ